MVLWLRLGGEKKPAVFRWTNSNLDGAVFKNFWFKIEAVIYMKATTTPVPDILFTITVSVTVSVTVTVTVSVTILHEKEFYSACILWYSQSVTSTMFIDNKTVLYLCLLCLWFHLEAVCKITEWQTAM